MVNFNIGFTADTTQAKRAIAELTRELNNISTASSHDLGFARISSDLVTAKTAAMELEQHLKLATNIDTGKLDVNKLQANLKRSGTSLQKYAQDLKYLGPAGQQAFKQLTNAVLSAEVPAKKLNKLFKDLLVSFKNTLTWQISSSVLMGFTGAISSAVTYAKELNTSLNNIRIVTGQSTDQMAKFAKEANKAAKNLSTTTTAYTDAALIYYQQGLADDEVVERTNATIKMANVTGENAQNVSSYMTAIWNNFDNGSKSLEYYADVITALGAATASSSEEIAGGLEKFAAIGQTVGLSYEYATAALATVVSETRQSEDVVGTSFKTIFARLQGLQQGEEQEDGVTLNKYSAALKSVGIDIIETNGELKAMDNILNELGSKWKTLGEAEKVALAQTVGGVRQYTQLISLMENWDTFQDNLNVAYNSEGSLEEQSQIYEESWAAATNRITAALEEMWNALVNDEAFIKFFDIIADFIDLLDNVIDGLGGFKGLLTSIGTIATKLFEKEMTSGLMKLQTFLTPKKILDKELRQNQGDILSIYQNEYVKDSNSPEHKILAQKIMLVEKSHELNDVEKARWQLAINIQEKELEVLQRRRLETDELKKQLSLEGNLLSTAVERAEQVDKGYEHGRRLLNNNLQKVQFPGESQNIESFKKSISDIFSAARITDSNGRIRQGFFSPETTQQAQLLLNAIRNSVGTTEQLEQNYQRLLNLINSSVNSTKSYEERLRESLALLGYQPEQINNIITAHEAEIRLINDENAYLKTQNKILEKNKLLQPKEIDPAQNITMSVQALTSALGVLNSTFALYDVWVDKSTSITDKLTSSISSLASGGMQAVYAFNSFQTAFKNLKSLSEGSGLLGWLGAAGPWIAAILVGLYAIVKVIDVIQKKNKENSFEERVNRLKEENDKLINSYNDLNSAMDRIKQQRDSLSSLTKGTREWKEAVVELNQQILDLIQLHPELAKFVITSDDGIMSLDDTGWNEYLDKQLAILELHQQGLMGTQILETKEDITPKNKNYNYDYNYQWGYNTDGRRVKKSNDTGYFSQDDALALYQEAIRFGAFDENGKFDLTNENLKNSQAFQKLFGQLEEGGDQFNHLNYTLNDLIPDLKILNNEINSSSTEFNALQKTDITTWLSKNYKDTTGGVATSAVATGMEQYLSAELQNADRIYKAANIETLYKDAIKLFGEETAGLIQSEFAEGRLSLDAIRSIIVSEVAKQNAYEKVNNDIDRYNNILNAETIGPELRKILLDMMILRNESSYNALNESDYNTLLSGLNNSDIQQLLVDSISQDFVDAMIGYLGKDYQSDYQDKANINRQALFDADADLTATNKGLTSGAFKHYRDNIEEQFEGLDGLSDLTEDYNILANDVAESTINWEKAGKKLGKTLKDNAENLDDSKEGTLEYSEALTAVAKDLSSWLGITVDEEFVKKHKKLIEKAITGDRESIIELEKFAAQHAINIMPNLSEEQKKDFNKIIDDFYTAVANKDIKVGKIDDTLFLEGLQNIVTASSMTKEQAESFLNGLDLKSTFTEVSIDDITTLDHGGGKYTNPLTGEEVEIPKEQMDIVKQRGRITVFGDVEFKGTKSGKNFTPSSSNSGSKKKDKKTKSDEIERYHEIRNTIEDLNKQLDETNKKKDRAFGKSKLKAYDDEISKLNELKDAQEQYLDEIEGNLKKDKNAILKYGVKFDENGNISNYDEVMEAQLNKFNKKRTEKAEKEYEEFKKLIAQYEETHDLLLDQQEQLKEYENQLHDEGLAAAAYKVEYQIELNDDDVEFLDYLIDQLSDNVTSLVEKIALIESKMVESLDNYGIYMDGIKDIFTNLNATRDGKNQLSEEVINRIINGDFTTEDLENWGLVGENSDLTAEDMSKLSEYRDSLLQTAKDLSDYQAAIYETISEGVEKTNAEFDKYSERLEHMFGLWEHFKNIVELTGNKYLGISKEMILALNKDAVQSKVAQVATDAEKLNLLREQLKAFQDENVDFLAGEYAKTESSVEVLKKRYQDLQIAVNEAENNLLSSWEDALSAANDLFQMSVETAITAFEEGISGTYGSLDMLQDAYDKQKDLGDLYLDDYKQIYELSKLTRDINKSIDDTDNIASKNKLKEIQQEINDLQEAGVELSQYDLDFLRAKYELRLAEIALEDAQNAKSQVRMTRDNDGNWSYTYTADQDNIDKAQQNYEDKLYAIQNLTSNYITTVEEQILALQNSMVDEMAGVDKTLYASEEEYLARLAEIQDYYTQKMDALSGQINNALGNNKEIYENDWKAYSEATDYKISANEKYIDSWNETQLSLLGGYETLEEYQETFMNLLGSIDDENSLIGQLASAYRSWSDVVEQISKATGMSIDELAKKIQTIPEESQEVTDEMKAMSEEMATAWEDILQGLKNFTETLADEIQKRLDGVKAFVDSLLDLMKELYNYEESIEGNDSSDSGSEPPPVSAASGGYTGAWGASGKLAILHEKELILNAEDTRNMLKVVGITRDIAKQIELNAIAAGSGLNNFAPGSVGQFQEVRQNIVINADFPNASNREEIAAAFDNLLNRASQYANRK